MPMVLRRCTLSELHAALPRHFDDIAQQSEASHLGMWVFLLTEIMFFGGMFTGYAVYRSVYAVAFAEGSHHLDLVLGSINTEAYIYRCLTIVATSHLCTHGSHIDPILI